MKKKMLFFHHCGTIGGAGISGLNFLNSVPKDTYEIVVYCTSIPANMAALFRENGYTVLEGRQGPVAFTHCVGSEKSAVSPKAFLNYYRVWKNRKAIDAVIREQKPDLVVVNSMTLFWIGKIAKKYHIKTLCFFRETYIKGLLGVRTGYIKRCLSNYFDAVSFISNYEMERSERIQSLKRTIYNMVRPDGYDAYTKDEARKRLGLDGDSFYVLFVGGVNRLKGTLVLLRAMEYIRDDRIKLLFVGSSLETMRANAKNAKGLKKLKRVFSKDYNTLCLEEIEKGNLKERIAFFGSQKDIAPFYKAADVLAFPMTRPHQARPLFEAGYAKIPVIITDFENIRELVDETSGYLFKNGNSEELAALIQKIKDNYEETKPITQRNYENTYRRHSPAVYSQQIQALLKEMDG